jgi:hypothetical protein
MEVAALFGLLGLGYGVSKISQTPASQTAQAQAQEQNPLAQNTRSAQVLPPSNREYPLLVRPGTQEGFMPAARGPNSDPLTVAPKGASAVGFGPDLDMMYQVSNGQTYPSEPSTGPYGTADNTYATADQNPEATGFTGDITQQMDYRADCDPAYQYIARSSPRTFGYTGGYL